MRPSAVRVAHLALRRHKLASLDLFNQTPEEQKKLVSFVTSMVPHMDDASVAYGFYVSTDIDDPMAKDIKTKLTQEYRERLLRWFDFAIKKRASLGGGGTGIKNLKEGIAAFVESLPEMLSGGYRPLTSFIRGNVSDIVDPAKLDTLSAKVVRVVRDAAQHFNARTASPKLPLEWDDASKVWFIPPNPATFGIKDALSKAGFRWDVRKKRWWIARVTPAAAALAKAPVAPPQPMPTLENWFFSDWLPGNIDRFNRVFNDHLKSKETSYTFSFSVSGKKVSVDISRQMSGPRDAVEELRHRYIGRQGREAWLEVLDKYTELYSTRGDNQVMLLIDRMNNLQHSNGLFLEQFPASVQSWYTTFLDRKYSAPNSWRLAAYIPDDDLRETLQFLNKYTGFRTEKQDTPDVTLQTKELPKGTVNWREKGYPYYPGSKQPSRFDPEVQEDLPSLPKGWTPSKIPTSDWESISEDAGL